MDNINKIYSISPPGFMRPDSDDISVDNTTSTTSESMQNCIEVAEYIRKQQGGHARHNFQ